jgi:antitoxin (DNA-binding transcriptional repressor) of toxin-antitoxin stability system
MTKININEAKSRLSHYSKRVKMGETIILCDRNRPFAEIRPLPGTTVPAKRKLGQLKGQCPVPDSFFDGDEQIAAEFAGDMLSARNVNSL